LKAYTIATFLFLLCFATTSKGQQNSFQAFFTPADTFNQTRFNYSLGFAATTYTAFSIGLYNTWYRQYPQESFHFFNDWEEWNQMDKAGHLYTSYFQGVLCYKGANWMGMEKKNAILTGIICGTLFQSTIEVMDGFSSEWGFSVPDIGANILGTTAFALQQQYWNGQRIQIKMNSLPYSYPNISIEGAKGTEMTLNDRANDLFGRSFAERFLKDYNRQVIWASVNIHSFFPETKLPKWLNIALGYGAENLYGGNENNWSKDGEAFILNEESYPRYSQFYLGLDVDFTKIKTNNQFVKSILSVFNIFKAPSPAIEVNTLGEIKFHLLR